MDGQEPRSEAVGAMDFNEYACAEMIRLKLAEARAEAERSRLARTARPPRRPVRRRVGGLLIVLGRRLEGGPSGTSRTAPRSESCSSPDELELAGRTDQ